MEIEIDQLIEQSKKVLATAEREFNEWKAGEEAIKAKEKKDEKIKSQLQEFIERNVPKTRFRNDYQHIHNGWVIGATRDMFSRGEFDLDEKGRLFLKDVDPLPEPKTGLDKIFSKPDFLKPKKEVITIFHKLLDTVNATGANRMMI